MGLDLALEKCQKDIFKANSTTHLLGAEAQLTKQLFKFAARAVQYGEFTRSKQGKKLTQLTSFLIMVII
ncbi:hypothetical protein [Coxiella burnetii]|uniref:hypothetical protein n=1 Tax=Coxiella burnetii TaxID=777 RepID=UPI0000DAE999|nr:hypothetical protein [Coxiella burnetii]